LGGQFVADAAGASFTYTDEAFRLGHDTGLFVDASWALFNEIWFAF